MRRAWTQLALLTLAAAAQAAPGGHLAFLKDGAAWVAPLGQGKAVKLPDSDHAAAISLAPNGNAFYFVPVGDKSDEGRCRGLLSIPPYAQATPLAKPLDEVAAPKLIWSAAGRGFLSAGELHGLLDTKGQFTATAWAADSSCREGKVVAYATDREIRVAPVGGQPKTLFSVGKPEALFAALKTARYPRKLKELTSAISADLYRDSHNWALGTPALTPDGKTVFFACNAGTSMGAQGNTQWAFFAADVATGKLQALSKVGSYNGRVPLDCAVSPDGKHLLFVNSYHNSAAENPSGVYVMDLLTQATRELLWDLVDPKKTGDVTTSVNGLCWSPDSSAVAVAYASYDPQKALKEHAWDLKDSAYVLGVFDAHTGKRLSGLPGAVQPAWSK